MTTSRTNATPNRLVKSVRVSEHVNDFTYLLLPWRIGLSVSGSVGDGISKIGPGSALDPWLHEKVITVSFTVKNNDSVAGHEIPQLYTAPPASTNSAPMNSKGFDSIFLNPGESKKVTMQLSRFDLSIWDVVSQRWTVPSGKTGISIGASSRDVRLTGSVTK